MTGDIFVMPSFRVRLWASFLLLLTAACVSSGSVSEKTDKRRPEWLTSFVREDSGYRYYAGRGMDKTELKALQAAEKDAYEQALRENFGVYIQFSSDMYLTETEASVSAKSSETSKLARIVDFRSIEQYAEKKDGEFQGWKLYRYSKKAIDEEKKRLAKLPEDFDDSAEFSVVGEEKNKARGVLEVVTAPSGITVYIDGARYGKTPLRLIGDLSAGPHKLRLDSINYEIIQENFTVFPSRTTTVKKKMLPARGTLSLTSSPEGAEAFLDNKFIGKTPLEISVQAGKPVSLKLRHEEAETFSLFVQAARGEVKKVSVPMVRKTSVLSVYSFPGGASVYFNNEKKGVTPLENIPFSEAECFLRLEKDGYHTVKSRVPVKGGTTRKVQFDLKKASEKDSPDPQRISPERRRSLGNFRAY